MRVTNLASLKKPWPPSASKVGELQTAIEIEVIRDQNLTSLITPVGGRLSGIYTTESLPKFLLHFYDGVPRDRLLNMSWDWLPNFLQNAVLSQISEGVEFEACRSYPGFMVKDAISIVAREDFSFLGRSYLRGRSYDIPLRGFMMPLVEYAASGMVKQARSMEFHFRSSLPFEEFRRNIGVFFAVVLPSMKGEKEVEPRGTHQHIPGRLPHEFFEKVRGLGYGKDQAAVALTFFVQMAELSLIIENAASYGIGLDVIAHKDPTKPPLIDFMTKDSLVKIYEYFAKLYDGEEPILGVSLKKNIVGVRSGEIYDQAHLWGLELRYNRFEQTGTEGFGYIADGIKQAMHTQSFSIDLELVNDFIEDHSQDLMAGLKATWFRGPALLQIQESAANPALAKLMHGYLRAVKLLDFPVVQDGFQPSAQILFFDWSRHPIMQALGDAETISRVQTEALTKAMIQGDFTVKDMAQFFADSGIAEVVRTLIYQR